MFKDSLTPGARVSIRAQTNPHKPSETLKQALNKSFANYSQQTHTGPFRPLAARFIAGVREAKTDADLTKFFSNFAKNAFSGPTELSPALTDLHFFLELAIDNNGLLAKGFGACIKASVDRISRLIVAGNRPNDGYPFFTPNHFDIIHQVLGDELAKYPEFANQLGLSLDDSSATPSVHPAPQQSHHDFILEKRSFKLVSREVKEELSNNENDDNGPSETGPPPKSPPGTIYDRATQRRQNLARLSQFSEVDEDSAASSASSTIRSADVTDKMGLYDPGTMAGLEPDPEDYLLVHADDGPLSNVPLAQQTLYESPGDTSRNPIALYGEDGKILKRQDNQPDASQGPPLYEKQEGTGGSKAIGLYAVTDLPQQSDTGSANTRTENTRSSGNTASVKRDLENGMYDGKHVFTLNDDTTGYEFASQRYSDSNGNLVSGKILIPNVESEPVHLPAQNCFLTQRIWKHPSGDVDDAGKPIWKTDTVYIRFPLVSTPSSQASKSSENDVNMKLSKMRVVQPYGDIHKREPLRLDTIATDLAAIRGQFRMHTDPNNETEVEEFDTRGIVSRLFEHADYLHRTYDSGARAHYYLSDDEKVKDQKAFDQAQNRISSLYREVLTMAKDIGTGIGAEYKAEFVAARTVKMTEYPHLTKSFADPKLDLPEAIMSSLATATAQIAGVSIITLADIPDPKDRGKKIIGEVGVSKSGSAITSTLFNAAQALLEAQHALTSHFQEKSDMEPELAQSAARLIIEPQIDDVASKLKLMSQKIEARYLPRFKSNLTLLLSQLPRPNILESEVYRLGLLAAPLLPERGTSDNEEWL